MGNSESEEIDRLLREGLDHYGDGDAAEAIRCWKTVLALDPANFEAADYLYTSERRERPRPERLQKIEAAQDSAVLEARELIAARQFDEALDLLRSTKIVSQPSLEMEATVDLLRTALLRNYRDLVGDGSLIPEIAVDSKRITEFNLPADAGFLLSLVDGTMSLESLISVSGMDSFEALRTTKSLMDAGIVRMRSCD